MLSGIKQSKSNVAAQKLIPIKYHLCKLSVRSINGAHTNRKMFAEIPTAVIEAAAATENPCCISRKGSVTVAKPTLMPYGNTRKTSEDGSVVVFMIHNFEAIDFPTLL